MLKQMRDRRRSTVAVKKNLTKLLWQVQSFEWALLWLESPTQGEGEKWRMETARTMERSLKNYSAHLKKLMRAYGVTAAHIMPIQISEGSKIPRKTYPSQPIQMVESKLTRDEEEKKLEYIFGGADPRLDKLTALELLSLGKYGTKEPDPEL